MLGNDYASNIVYTKELREKRRINSLGKNNPFYGKHHTESNKQVMRQVNQGNNNPNWKGDNASSQSNHAYVRRNYPPNGNCQSCKKQIPNDYLELANIRDDRVCTKNRNDYQYLCKPCHRKLDNIIRNTKR